MNPGWLVEDSLTTPLFISIRGRLAAGLMNVSGVIFFLLHFKKKKRLIAGYLMVNALDSAGLSGSGLTPVFLGKTVLLSTTCTNGH